MSQFRISRCRFMHLMSIAGGALALDPWIPSSPFREPLRLQGEGGGQRVIILGAGIAGLVAAYELTQAGYECIVLEARQRAGGRCWTLRQGDVVTELDGQEQTVAFDDGLYFNAGPDRIPQEHRGILSYCRTFNIPLQAFVTLNTATYFYNENVEGELSGQKVRLGRVWSDMQGHTHSLLARVISRGVLDEDLPPEIREQMIAFLVSFGDLAEEGLLYENASGRGGYVTAAGAGEASGEVLPTLELKALLASNLWRYFPIEWDYHRQLALVHPVGGMDRIIAGFTERLNTQITYDAVVTEIRHTDDGVQVVYGENGENSIEGAFCICTLPLPVLAELETDFGDEIMTAIAEVAYLPATKIGLQFGNRFWEDEDYIYGGVSFTNLPINQIWYPSHDYHAPKGILTGAFAAGQDALELGNMPPSERLQVALAQGQKIHESYEEAFETGVSVPWHKIPYSRGAWAVYTAEQRDTLYPRLLDFDERVFLAGDHMSYLSGWMEGAVVSALAAVERIHQKVRQP